MQTSLDPCPRDRHGNGQLGSGNSIFAVFNSLFPVFAIMGLGAGLTRIGFITPELQRGLNRIAFYVGLPTILFYKIAVADLNTPSAGAMLWTLNISTLVCCATSLFLGAILRVPRLTRGAMIQAGFRGNLAFVALPVILYTLAGLDIEGPLKSQIETAVILALVPTIITYNILSVTVLIAYGPPSDRPFFRETFVKLAQNPLIIGCVVGIAWNLLGLPLPLALERTCDSVGKAAFPLALLGIGSQLLRTPVSKRLREALVSSIIKNALAPVVGYFVGTAFGLQGPALTACLLLHATPTAVASYILADQMNSDSSMAATAVVVSTIVSILSFSVVLLWI